MQLARIQGHRSTRTIAGKARQAMRALALEVLYSKDEILEAYLNLVPYGGNVEGVGAASLIYFSKTARALTTPEVLTLAVIPQSPARRAFARADLESARALALGALRRVDRAGIPSRCATRASSPRRSSCARRGSLPFAAPHLTTLLLARSPGGFHAHDRLHGRAAAAAHPRAPGAPVRPARVARRNRQRRRDARRHPRHGGEGAGRLGRFLRRRHRRPGERHRTRRARRARPSSPSSTRSRSTRE